jgi:tetrahedral aminopeptidase
MNLDLLKNLCLCAGISGFEKNSEIVNFLYKKLSKINYPAKTKIDTYGNIISRYGQGSSKLLLEAHLDEVGFIFDKTNSINVVGEFNLGKITGSKINVIGKSITGSLESIEGNGIGFIKKGGVAKPKPGDLATFNKVFRQENENIFATSLDNRVGCFVLLKIAEKIFSGETKLPAGLEVLLLFSVGEETGNFFLENKQIGADSAFGIVVDAAYANPVDFKIGKDDRIPEMGNGAAIQHKGRGFKVDSRLITTIVDLSLNAGIKTQPEIPPEGLGKTNLAELFQLGLKGGVAINVPVALQHQKESVVSVKDIKSTIDLISLLIEKSQKLNG